MPTTLGREIIRQKLPDKYKPYADRVWDKKVSDALMTAMAMQPNYTLDPIPSKKKVEKKQSYEGLTISLMEEYLNLVFDGELAAEARTQFAAMKAKKEQRELSYPTIKSWFLDLFPKFNVNKAKKQINEKKLENKKAPHQVVKVTIAVPHATNK
jgi:hypothetical protein